MVTRVPASRVCRSGLPPSVLLTTGRAFAVACPPARARGRRPQPQCSLWLRYLHSLCCTLLSKLRGLVRDSSPIPPGRPHCGIPFAR
ncbi:hypothetical protein BD309DRAFT_955784 [Dichomitus squalens]|nr:hypothetical protein BD309DRAFT_955784 [Dichomitus squalens]